MRPQLHRAALRRFAFRLGLVAALFLGLGLVLPVAGFREAAFDGRALVGVALIVGGAAVALASWRRPRPRVTAPRQLARAS
jgi:hypothetical protein